MKQQIKGTALKLFLKYGPKRTTVDDVIWELQISKKVFYEHFSNKEELITDIFREIIDETKNTLQGLSEDIEEDLTLLLVWQYFFYSYLKRYSAPCIYELNKYYPELVEAYRKFRKNCVFKNLMNFTKNAQKQGLLRENINVRIFVEMQLYCLEELLFGRFNLVNNLTQQEQDNYADHIIINNIRGTIQNDSIHHFEECRNKVLTYRKDKSQ